MIAHELMTSLYKYYHSSNMNFGDHVGLFMSVMCMFDFRNVCLLHGQVCSLENEYQKDRRRDEIGVCAQNT